MVHPGTVEGWLGDKVRQGGIGTKLIKTSSSEERDGRVGFNFTAVFQVLQSPKDSDLVSLNSAYILLSWDQEKADLSRGAGGGVRRDC